MKNSAEKLEASLFLRHQAKLDIVVSSNVAQDQADVRETVIMDVSHTGIVVAQTSPPILQSMIGRAVQATVVRQSLIGRNGVRWGWTSQILGLDNEYPLTPNDPDSLSAPVVFMSLPTDRYLTQKNIRLAYRLEVNPVDGIEISVKSSRTQVSLINFSVGGMLLATPPPPVFSMGQPLSFSLVFHETEQKLYSRTVIKGQFEVVRMEYGSSALVVRYGVQFVYLDAAASRDLSHITNVFMREELRKKKM